MLILIFFISLCVILLVRIYLLTSKLSTIQAKYAELENDFDYVRSSQDKIIDQLREDSISLSNEECNSLREENALLRPYMVIPDVEAHVAKLTQEAQDKAGEIEAEALKLLSSIRDEERIAAERAQDIISKAEQKAIEIAGDAIKAKKDAAFYEKTAAAMKNIINEYGKEYIVPSHSLLDDLAEIYGYTQEGEELKCMRALIRELIQKNRAAICDHSESIPSNTVTLFVLDAFNGRVDSILSRAKVYNYEKLNQEILDAFSIVNYNGQAFGNARITDEYCNVRLNELRLACTMHEFRQRDIEEQRRIKEQIREEEKTRREIEKALQEVAKEKEAFQSALANVKAQMEQASEGQRAKYKTKIVVLEQNWKEAEERNQKAISMTQQTKGGYIYIISNVGSFGENVYKIGMTRRPEPFDRVHELGASVPFPFDVHAMIWSNDAPSLEAALHKKFALEQLNKVNYYKKFFKVSLHEIRKEIEETFGKDNLEITWTMAAEAREYRESLAMEKSLKDHPETQRAWMEEHQSALEARTLLEVLNADDEEEKAV